MNTHVGLLLRVVLVLGLWFAPQTQKTQITYAKIDAPYPRAGWTTKLSTLQHGVSGTAEIGDERTIVLRNFNYDGGGPRVYAYLATANTNAAIESGLVTVQQLNRPGNPYVNETITVTLPASATLDGYTVISIWCADFKVNFGSGVFRGRTFVPTLARGS